MFDQFKYEPVELSKIRLDKKNARLVTPTPLKTQNEILEFFFEHEDLLKFIKKITRETKNPGAENPYIVKSGSNYTVIEGNTRIAAYKVLTGQMNAPKDYAASIPHISEKLKKSLMVVDCSIAPDRDSLLPIVASAHFGTGDKSSWCPAPL